MSYQLQYYPETAFGGFTRMDGTIAFYVRVNALCTESSTVLDFGCGRGRQFEDQVKTRRDLRMLKGRVARIIGLDVDPDAASNPGIDEFHLLATPGWPIPDASIDVCLADAVLEHVAEPDVFFAECRRVLRPGGYVCIRTPNAWSYAGIAARLLSNRLHGTILSRVQENRKEVDIFPTFYRCNSIRRLRRHLAWHGFQHVVFGHEAEPAYLSFARAAYWLGTVHQAIAPSRLRCTLFAFGRASEDEGTPERDVRW
jgi:SAM-dependent methyltransferase